MNRFFVNQKNEDYFILDAKTLKHLNVIRINSDPFICIYQEKFYKCILEYNRAKVIEEINENHEFDFEVVVGVSLIKYERFEWALQKLVELGASKIIPMITNYTNGELYKFDKFQKKLERFKTIIQNAAEQSFRNKIPELGPLTKFEDILKLNNYQIFIAHEKENCNNLIPNDITVNTLFLVGPEGGFSEDEVFKAIELGAKPVSLGKRILRAETAAIYMMSKIKN
ncbi:16S rRNA (uracil(1498)-N(3))-methyltransferase [Mycoplasmopsis cynos]|uniref:16S rRNA (uracil(1498)-N(3))-methyltransferase n=1 Tax=Mycoplasmopsis cynos TaxID=171284 RepID=UPI002AFE7FE5|nr:16S rRNA (uracil(1498)-N(3))-methyltransferase [Mycoplasmopsis cynos]WQQ18854.1 16S rRNA (uracil(1498)-N(3))-methyltransferase [Mycoplasmopsis cynos]